VATPPPPPPTPTPTPTPERLPSPVWHAAHRDAVPGPDSAPRRGQLSGA
jgi:hypothetical protein